MNAEADTARNQVAQKLSVGYQWLRSEQPARAQQVFEAALILDPANGRAHAWRAVALLQQVKTQKPRTVTERAARQRMREAAQAETREALSLAPDDSFVRYLCAHVLRQTGKARRALELLEENVSRNPHNETTWLEIARCRMVMLQTRQAETAVRRAIECAPLSSSAYEVLAWVLERRGKRGEARRTWQTALQLNPESAGAHVALGREYLRDCRLDQAEQFLSEGLRLKPDSALAQSQLNEVQLLQRSPFLRVMTHLYAELLISWKAKIALGLLLILSHFRNDHHSPLAWLFWALVVVSSGVALWRAHQLLRETSPSGSHATPGSRSASVL